MYIVYIVYSIDASKMSEMLMVILISDAGNVDTDDTVDGDIFCNADFQAVGTVGPWGQVISPESEGEEVG